MSNIEKFTLTEQHIKLLRRACVTWNHGESGAPTISCKRPYGNSDVVCDIAEILGIQLGDEYPDEILYDQLWNIHLETKTALQIILSTGSFEAGEYERVKYFGNWKRVE